MLIATAGHIDHGKTSLVRALTGAETDRLPEERRRGISIDLGFAHWQAAPGRVVGFVDVPGHERFVRNMLAGVAAADTALLVVAADDGVMPQTVEHADILDLLGISQGFVALTKTDKASPARVAEVGAQVAALLSRRSLAGAPVFPLSSATGEGVGALAAALRQAALARPSAPDTGRAFRLAIDRAFSIHGAGTVVTGTALDGPVTPGARLVLSPAGRELRVRGLQSAGRAAEWVEPGRRCAVNLPGLEPDQVRRGDWLVAPASHAPTARIAIRLRLLTSAPGPLVHNGPVHVHHGTADLSARLLLPGRTALPPGEEARGVLILDQPTAAVAGDRLVLRDPSGRHLLGGGRVIEPLVPAQRRRNALREALWDAMERPDPALALSALLAIPGHEVDVTGFVQAWNLTEAAAAEIFATPEAVVLGKGRRKALSRAAFVAAGDAVIATLGAFHAANPQLPGMPQAALEQALTAPLSAAGRAALLRELIDQGRIVAGGGAVRIASHRIVADTNRQGDWQTLLQAAQGLGGGSFTLADLAGALRRPEKWVTDLVVGMRGNGDIWRLAETRFLLREQVFTLAATARALTERQPEAGFTAARFRDASGIGRNLAIQVLEFYDRVGATRRQGDIRWMRDVWREVLTRAAQLERGLTPRAYLPPPVKRGPGWR